MIQLEEIAENRYKVNVSDELEFGENTMYRDDITKEQYRQRNKILDNLKLSSDAYMEVGYIR